MADDINAITAECLECRLRTSPTWAHEIASHQYAGTFEDVSRAAEDAEITTARDFAERAERIRAEAEATLGDRAASAARGA